jgi:hypothetical protein
MSVGVSAIPSVYCRLGAFCVVSCLQISPTLFLISFPSSYLLLTSSQYSHSHHTKSNARHSRHSKMASKWTKEAEQKLLFAAIAPADIRPDWGSISKAMGPEFTGESCRSVHPSCAVLSFVPHLSPVLIHILKPNTCNLSLIFTFSLPFLTCSTFLWLHPTFTLFFQQTRPPCFHF